MMIRRAMQILTPSIKPLGKPSLAYPMMLEMTAAKIKIWFTRSSKLKQMMLHKDLGLGCENPFRP